VPWFLAASAASADTPTKAYVDTQALDQAWTRRSAKIRQAEDTGCCPECGAEMLHSSMHERDSSNDLHWCLNCDWGYWEQEAWAAEREGQKPN